MLYFSFEGCSQLVLFNQHFVYFSQNSIILNQIISFTSKSTIKFLLQNYYKNKFVLSSSTMNPLYPFVESVINQGSPEALQSIITSLGQEPGQTHSEYSCGENTFYVLKRLIGASLARDPKIKEHAAEALKSIVTDVEDLKKINLTAFQDFFITTTAMTDCKTKQEKSAYIQGKLNVIKEMLDSFKKSQKILTHLVEIANQNENFQEEILEVLYLLNGDKLSGLKLKLSDSNNSQVLLDILQKKKISQQIINKLIASAIQSYPHPSIALKYLGANLENILASPQEFFKSHYAQFLDVSQQQTEDGDLKKLYYLLEIQFYFLKNVTLAPQNIAKFLCKQMVVVWLEQLRVKNKHMKKVANQMTINFNESHEFCFEVLKYLHEQKIYLENVSPNHPFDQLYRNVQVTKFWKYLNDLIKKEDEKKDEIQDQNDENVSKKQEYLSQLQYITRQRSDVLTPDQIGETLTILIHSYQQSKRSQKLLNLVWSLFHSILTKVSEKNKSKKKLILNTKGPLILSKINLTQLQLEQQIQQTLTKAIKFLRIKVKSTKQNQSSSKVIVALLNFITGLVVYSIVYPEQSDVCGEIQFIYKDLQSFLSKEQGTENDVLKKKRKKSQDVEDPKKPIHVLIQVFISLLTKAPIFLRNSINLIFEQLVPYLETSDLDTLLDVIQKPDQEYIEEI